MVRSNLLLIILFFSFYKEILSQVYPEERVDYLLKTGIANIVNQDYLAAEVVFNSLDKEYPRLPLGKIYLAANKIAEAYDYAEDFDEVFITETLVAAKEQAEELISKDDENIWYHYFYALAEGYTSYFNAINGSWLSAISTGVNSISKFEKILESNNNFFEAYIALGTFEYWKSRKMDFMDWLPFSNNTKEIGIERLRIAIDSSSYNTYLAINSLIWIYIDQKKYSDAIVVSKRALTQFPSSRAFKWGMARAYEEQDPSKSIELYLDILNSYPLSKKNNYINKITLMHIIAQQYVKLGDNKNALKYCNEILSIKNLSPRATEVLEERLQRVRVLQKELSGK